MCKITETIVKKHRKSSGILQIGAELYPWVRQNIGIVV